MYDIGHRVGMNAPLSEVYEALATREGVARWWTRDVEGERVCESGRPAPASAGLGWDGPGDDLGDQPALEYASGQHVGSSGGRGLVGVPIHVGV